LVSEQLMQSLAPLGMEAAIEAIESLESASDERIQQKALALEQAHYEVTRARRQYDVYRSGRVGQRGGSKYCH
jgi:hypothetical protein